MHESTGLHISKIKKAFDDLVTMASAQEASALKVEKVPLMPTARTFCQAFDVGNEAFVIGGCDIKGIALATMESIDLRSVLSVGVPI